MSHNPGTLSDLLASRRISADEAIRWSSSIAAQLSALHEQGHSHGDVAAASVTVEVDRVLVTPRMSGQTATGQQQDIVQFAALLREMLAGVRVEDDRQRAQWRALDRLAATNARAAADSRMKRVATALRLLSRGAKVEPIADVAPVIEQEAPLAGRRVIMLVREVPPEVPAKMRVKATTVHVLAYLGSAASIAIIGCMMIVKLTS